KVKTEDLADHFMSPNVWERMTAHRLFLERKDHPDPKSLARLLPGHADRFWRLHVVCLLEALGAADEGTLRSIFLHENEPRILEHAVRLAEPFLARSERIREYVFDLAENGDAQLRFQVALSLGEWDDDRILGPLANIALRGADDRWTRLAVASSVPKRAGA